ncbi:MAG: GNAT family N-acetyltransferase [Candidatus Kerfeldbacteria bacterium]|nr:GNAT family N-acetyltransferase [Candidatus Kerfeldbacteria bacterium]
MPAWTLTTPPVPESLGRRRREANLLWYRPSRIMAAKTAAGMVGAIRYALRDDPDRNEGLITDLVVEQPYWNAGLPAALIEAAEQALRADRVEKIDAVVQDGQKLSESFHAAGYWPFRKTVVLEWDLTRLKDIPASGDFAVELVDQIDREEIADFVFQSYQPYWRWWKETDEDKPIGRAEYPVDEPKPILEKVKRRNWARVVKRLREFNAVTPQRMVIARQGRKIIGLCDVKADPEESMDWGVLISRDVGGRAVGSALLGPALGWLREQGVQTAQVTTTSGLDDYDPVVYLYVLVSGAQIRGEFLVLRKHLRAVP